VADVGEFAGEPVAGGPAVVADVRGANQLRAPVRANANAPTTTASATTATSTTDLRLPARYPTPGSQSPVVTVGAGATGATPRGEGGPLGCAGTCGTDGACGTVHGVGVDVVDSERNSPVAHGSTAGGTSGWPYLGSVIVSPRDLSRIWRRALGQKAMVHVVDEQLGRAQIRVQGIHWQHRPSPSPQRVPR
jgi:hypothetical protein